MEPTSVVDLVDELGKVGGGEDRSVVIAVGGDDEALATLGRKP